MTEPGEQELDAALSAYRHREPRRKRSPFGHPQFALIAAERRARAAAPFYRRWIAHPAPAFAASALALFLLFAPGAPLPVVERAELPTMVMGAAPTTMTGVVADEPVATPSAPMEASDLILLVIAATAATAGLRSLRRTRG